MSSILATEMTHPADTRTPIYAMRWGAIFAGLAVGLSLHLLLMLLGAAGGLTALEVTERVPDAGRSALIAGIWNTVSMLVAAFVGAYVAARASGLKRTNDGLLHGAVAWGATTLLTAILATSAIGGAVGGAFSALRPVVGEVASQATSAVTGGRVGAADAAAVGSLADQLKSGNRDQAVATLRDRFGLTDEQAARVADGLGGVRERAEAAKNDPQVRQRADQAADAAGLAMWWLFGSVLLSLLAALGGGALGVRTAANRQRTRRERADALVGDPAASPRHVIRPDLSPEATRYSSDPRAIDPRGVDPRAIDPRASDPRLRTDYPPTTRR
jgi:hypothetical protein